MLKTCQIKTLPKSLIQPRYFFADFFLFQLILLSSTDVEFMQPKAMKCLDRDNIGLIGQ